jgi:hypothetical protein
MKHRGMQPGSEEADLMLLHMGGAINELFKGNSLDRFDRDFEKLWSFDWS